MTEDEWLDACADQPDDDLLRLAFADWLEERGDANRAEFIRLRVELSRQETQDPRKAARAGQLLGANRLLWLGPLVSVASESYWRFPRGLPEKLDVRARLGLGVSGISALASSPHLRRVIALDLSHNEIRDPGATELASSPHLFRLTSLDLQANQIGAAGATALAASPHLSRLISLNLCYNALGLGQMSTLACWPRLSRLHQHQSSEQDDT